MDFLRVLTLTVFSLGAMCCLVQLATLDISPQHTLPTARSGRDLGDELAVALVIEPDGITVDGLSVLHLDDFALDPRDVHPRHRMMVTDLYDRLLEKAECSKCLGIPDGAEFRGRLLLYAHPDTPAELLGRVLETCRQAQFGDVGFVVRPA